MRKRCHKSEKKARENGIHTHKTSTVFKTLQSRCCRPEGGGGGKAAVVCVENTYVDIRQKASLQQPFVCREISLATTKIRVDAANGGPKYRSSTKRKLEAGAWADTERKAGGTLPYSVPVHLARGHGDVTPNHLPVRISQEAVALQQVELTTRFQNVTRSKKGRIAKSTHKPGLVSAENDRIPRSHVASRCDKSTLYIQGPKILLYFIFALASRAEGGRRALNYIVVYYRSMRPNSSKSVNTTTGVQQVVQYHKSPDLVLQARLDGRARFREHLRLGCCGSER